jgi:hypothetical protein
MRTSGCWFANPSQQAGEAMKTICVVTDIAAPAEFVWAELTAISKYATWNPFITAFRGDLVQGSRLEIRIEPPGGRAMTSVRRSPT